MSIVDRMAKASLAEWMQGDHGPVVFEKEIRAALRAVKPEDVSDGMLGAFHLSNSIVATDETSDDRLRRAIAAAIAAGAEQ